MQRPTFSDAMDLVDSWSGVELGQLSRDQIIFIASGLTRAEFSEFMFAKNVKVFGGINGYVDNFLGTATVAKIKAMPDIHTRTNAAGGAIQTLEKMLTYGDLLSPENRGDVEAAIADLREVIAEASVVATAAGGKRNSRRRKGRGSRRGNRKTNRK